MAVNIKKIDLSQFMLNEDDEMMMKKMDKKLSLIHISEPTRPY